VVVGNGLWEFFFVFFLSEHCAKMCVFFCFVDKKKNKKKTYIYIHHSYSKEAFRGGARGLVKDLERVRPSAILDIVRSGEMMRTATADSDVAAPRRSTAKLPEMRTCEQCGYMASQKLCKACVLLERLNAGRAKVAVEIEQEE
jgi:cytoplasmic tRNA 2-thiolation protein 1